MQTVEQKNKLFTCSNIICINYPKELCHICRHFCGARWERSFFREIKSRIKVYMCTLTWTTFLKEIFAAPWRVSKTCNNCVFSSLPSHPFIRFSLISQAVFHLTQSIFLTKIITGNYLIFFSTSLITYIFNEPMPLVVTPQQDNFTL